MPADQDLKVRPGHIFTQRDFAAHSCDKPNCTDHIIGINLTCHKGMPVYVSYLHSEGVLVIYCPLCGGGGMKFLLAENALS